MGRDSEDKSADALPLPLLGELTSFWTEELMQHFALTAQRWAGCVPRLSAWEDEHLLDNPPPEKLAEHRRALVWMLRLGRLLSLTTKDPEYPDSKLAAMVAASMQSLQDKMDLWHGSMLSEPQRREVLQQVFGES